MKTKAWKFALAALAVTGGAAQVEAGDYKGGQPYATVNNWSGYYAGAALGFSRTSVDASTSIASPFIPAGAASVGVSARDTDIAGSLLAGYNWQNGNQVYGIEGEINFLNGFDYMASVRGRYGFISDNWLYYGTAGVAFIDSGTSASAGGFNVEGYSSAGVVFGGGAETKINSHVTAGVEGLYTIFAEDSQNIGFGITTKQSVDVLAVRARLTYKFD